MSYKKALDKVKLEYTHKCVVGVPRVLVDACPELNDDVADERSQVPLCYNILVISWLKYNRIPILSLN